MDNYIPLSERMRPESLEDFLGQDHLVGPDCVLTRALRSGRIFPLIFWGPPGSGKTTLARIMAHYVRFPFTAFSAVTSGVKELRKIIDDAKKELSVSGKPTILFVDEIHRFNKAQQDAFLPHVESGLIILIGATTQNPSFEVIPPLLSRTRVMIFNPLCKKEIKNLLSKAIKDDKKGFGRMDIEIMPDALEFLAAFSRGDARVALNNLEASVLHALDGQDGGEVLVDIKTVETATDRKALPYDKNGEEHYNLISAFHKSLRGSDAQASIYWLYRMLTAGEDPLFIGRRMIRFASEDIGMADPNALQIALSAFDAWQKVGPPEAELALIEAAVYLATAPKSNALYLAEKNLKQEIKRSGAQPVPLHIRNAPTALMKKLGYSRKYLYPHNYPDALVKQDYLPEKIKNRQFYIPTGRGFEGEIKKRMRRLKSLQGTRTE